MRSQIILSFFLLGSACHKKEAGSPEKKVPQFALGDRKGLIPLDVVGGEASFVLAPKEEAPAEAKVLTNFEGRAQAPFVMRDKDGVSLRGAAAEAQFSDFFVVSERSPVGADADPSERIYNLPELMDRLIHEEKLPEDTINAYQTGDSTLLIVVKKPTVIAASFSQGRTIQIVNSSRLVLICPYCENIEIRQAKLSEAQADPVLEIYSNMCLSYDYRSPGTLARYLFGEAFMGDIGTRVKCDRLDPRSLRQLPVVPKPAKIGLEPWMPQALLTQQIRKEHISETALRWRQFYPISSVR